MNASDAKQRFAELDAARALGDLAPEEHAEWQRLIEQEGCLPDPQFDLIVAGLESNLGQEGPAPSAALVDRLEADAAAETAPEVAPVIPLWRHPLIGWAAAACFAVLFFFRGGAPEPEIVAAPTPAEARNALLAASTPTQLDFAGLADYEGLSGDVVWDDVSQTGYMRFTGLPANDPTVAQYQLWIVDPERDERPVDGGVFDIPAGDGEVVVPIRAALAVDQPVAFVITVEKPGGVVVSAQEIVAAIAQRG